MEKNPIYRPQNWGDIVAYFTDLYTEITGKAPEVEVTGPALEARELMDKGYSLTALKRYDEAITAYDQAIVLPARLCVGMGKKRAHLSAFGAI